MVDVQHFACDTPDCIFWNEGDCGKNGAVTIQERCCMDYEKRLKHSIVIYVDGGAVCAVYASPDLADVDVELLDMDHAKVSEEGSDGVQRRHEIIRETYPDIL